METAETRDGKTTDVTAAGLAKRCPRCGRAYPAEYAFCQDDAAALVAAPVAPGGTGSAGGVTAAPGRAVRDILRPGGRAGRAARVTFLGAVLAVVGLAVLLPLARRHAPAAQTPAGAAGAVVSAPAAVPSPSPRPEGARKTYASNLLHFRLDFPPDWSGEEYQDLGSRGGAGHMVHVRFRGPEPGVSALAAVDLRATGPDAAANWRALDARFRKVYGARYRLLSLGDATLDGQRAAVWHFVLERKGQPAVERLDAGTFFHGWRHAFLFSAPPGRFARWEPTFRRMLASVRWMDTDDLDM